MTPKPIQMWAVVVCGKHDERILTRTLTRTLRRTLRRTRMTALQAYLLNFPFDDWDDLLQKLREGEIRATKITIREVQNEHR